MAERTRKPVQPVASRRRPRFSFDVKQSLIGRAFDRLLDIVFAGVDERDPFVVFGERAAERREALRRIVPRRRRRR